MNNMYKFSQITLDEAECKVAFLTKISYKSGNVNYFWFYSLEMTDTSINWESAETSRKPVVIGFDEIESVSQVDTVKDFQIFVMNQKVRSE